MMRGSRLVDYVVHIGKQICTNNDLQDNQLSCRPPKVKPSSTVNDTIYCDQYLSISVRHTSRLIPFCNDTPIISARLIACANGSGRFHSLVMNSEHRRY